MNIAFVSSQGGHLGQIKLIFTDEVIGKNKAIIVTESPEEPCVKKNSFLGKYKTYFFRKDYLGFNAFRYLTTILKFYSLFKKEKIDLVITNGAQISIPAVIAARLLRKKSIFLDTVIRVKTPNWSARACYLFSDYFFVQHKNMARKYGKRARFVGGII